MILSWVMFFILILVVGALAGPSTLLHNLALTIDVAAQSLGCNRVLCITISSRAGLAARRGRDIWSSFICLVFWNQQHCEDAIRADVERSLDSLQLLFDGEQKADAAIAYLRTLR